jgi:arylsulfatase A-like enzyme
MTARPGQRRLTRRRLVAGAGLGVAGAAALGAGLRLGSTGDDDPEPRNVLLVVIDSLRADHVGAYGADVRTPNVDALAAGGVRFSRVYPEAMPTMPMRRTIMTGRRIFPFRAWHPWAGVGGSPGWGPIMPDRTRTLVDDFRRGGHSTAYVTDNPFIGYAEALGPFRQTIERMVAIPGHAGKARPKSTGDDRDARRVLPAHMRDNPDEVRLMRDYLAQNGGADGLDIREAQTPAGRVFAAAIEQLRRVAAPRRDGRPRRPFFMAVDSFDPHEPWVPPRRYRALYQDPDLPFVGNIAYGDAARLTADEIDRLQATYKASVTHVDAHLGRLLDEVDRLRLADTTTVMLVADHGILLGERDWVGKSAWLLGPEMAHVPLIIRHPGADGGLVSDWLADTPDIPPTLMSLAGLTPPGRFEGSDLTPIVDGGEAPEQRDITYGGYANDFYVRDDDWALVSDNRMAGSQLYDLRADPRERDDISADNPDVVADMRRRMLAKVPEPPRFYRPEDFEREPRRLPARLRG